MSDLKLGAVAATLTAAAHYVLTSLPELLAWLVPLAYRIAPQVSWLPAGALEKAVLVGSAGLVVWYGSRWLGGLVDSLR